MRIAEEWRGRRNKSSSVNKTVHKDDRTFPALVALPFQLWDASPGRWTEGLFSLRDALPWSETIKLWFESLSNGLYECTYWDVGSSSLRVSKVTQPQSTWTWAGSATAWHSKLWLGFQGVFSEGPYCRILHLPLQQLSLQQQPTKSSHSWQNDQDRGAQPAQVVPGRQEKSNSWSTSDFFWSWPQEPNSARPGSDAGRRACRLRKEGSEGRPRRTPRNLLKNWLFCVCNTLYCLWNELLRKLGTLSTVSANNGKSSSSEDLTTAFRRTKHQAGPKSFLFLRGLLNTETINGGKFLIKDQHHTGEWAAKMPSMWPFGIAEPNPRVGPGASRPLPRAFFPRKEEEKEGQGWMARLLTSAGRAGTSV